MYLLYSLGLAVLLLLTSPYWLLHMALAGRYRAGLRERLGRVPPRIPPASARGAIWIHAVSVGEVLAVAPIANELRDRHPQRRLVVSTTTQTGQKLARERFGEANVFYLPFDFAFAIRPWLRTLQPQLLVLAETEFWPNLLRLARRSGADVAVVNARISDRSFPRYRFFRPLMARILRHVAPILAQSQEDARRLVAIGAPAPAVVAAGNLKFDAKPAAAVAFVGELRAAFAAGGAGPVIVAGSTLAGEEEILLAAMREVLARYPQAVMVVAPRRPERFAAVADLLRGSGVAGWRRTELTPGAALRGGVLLLDSIGELGAVYGLADVAFVGGSLVPAGGHNIIEPAAAAVPVLVGPYTYNFRDVVETFARAGAVRVVTRETLAPTLLELLADDSARRQLGARAAGVVRENAGATARTLAALDEVLAKEPAAPVAVAAAPLPHASRTS